MSEEFGRLLAAIAQLEERLSTRIDDGFKEMEKLTDRKLKEINKEMAEMKREMGKNMEEMESRIMKKLEGGSTKTSVSNMDISSDGLEGWDCDRSDYYLDEMKTAIEPGTPRKNCSIEWTEGDEIIRKMQAERMSKGEEIPSFWNYDPRCLAKEFVGLDQKTFLVDPSTFNICFFDKDILGKISKMLIPMDFVNLSYTCRFLHWRLFTFCTCYGPDEVVLEIHDLKVGNYYNQGEAVTRRYEAIPNKTVYTLRLEENDRLSMPRLAKLEGRRSVVARIPSCLRKPFFFGSLYFILHFPFFTKDDFDRCLPFIMPSLKFARHVSLMMIYVNPMNADKFYDYQATNDLFQTLNVVSYGCIDRYRGRTEDPYNRKSKVFESCPYTRLMDEVTGIHFDSRAKWENLVLLNRIGHYQNPPVSTIIRTIEEFKYGTANLDYHEYQFRSNPGITAFLEYFYSNYAEVEEYSREYDSGLDELELDTVKFVMITTKETGRRHTMKLSIGAYWYKIFVAIGKEDVFTKNIKKRGFGKEDLEDCRTDPEWYRMETALEPDEGDEDEQETAAGSNSV